MVTNNYARDRNLDVLRAFAIFGVVTLHIVGGVLGFFKVLSWDNELVISVSLATTYCSVNLFGLLSGYLKIDRRHHNSSFVRIVFQTLFWCVLIMIVSALFCGQSSFENMMVNLFPFTKGRLWYISSYLFVFMCVPYLNKLANTLKKSEYKKMLIILAVLMSLIPTICFKDFFNIVNNGYSAAWLAYMYLMGAYFKKNGFSSRMNKCRIGLLLMLTIILTTASRYVMTETFRLVGYTGDRSLQFFYYCSPLTVIISICFLFLFTEITVRDNLIGKFFTWISTVSLGIYIIHAHPYSLDHIINGANLSWIIQSNAILTWACFMGVIAGIVIVAGLLEQCRMILFELLNIDTFSNYLGDKLDNLLNVD